MSSATKNDAFNAKDIISSIDGLLIKLEHCDISESEGSEIERLDKHFESLQAIQYALSLRIAKNRQHRNSFTPFHRLPAELAVTTFQLVLQGEEFKYFFRLAYISSVSSAWRAIVLSSPALWSFIHPSIPKTWIELVFKRSQNYPLKASFDRRAIISEILEQLIRATPRIRSLELYIPGDPSQILKLANLPAPLLEKLALEASVKELDAKEGIDFFKGHAPRLEAICLRGISIRWDSAILFGLKSLELNDLTHGSPSLTQLLHILSQSPKLTLLTLIHIRLPNKTSSNTNTALPINLPNLKSLCIDGLKLSDMLPLLESIRFPLCRDIYLGFKKQKGPTSGLLPASIAHVGPSIAAAMASHQNMEIQMDRKSIKFNMKQDGKKSGRPFTMQIATRSFPQYLEWLADLLPHPSDGYSPAVKVTFKENFQDDSPAIFRVLDRMKVTKLILGSEGLTNAVCQRLANPTPASHTSHRWMFTNLQHLHVCVFSRADSLLEMLEARYPRPIALETTELPLPLESLNIGRDDGFNARVVKRAQEILGPGVMRLNEMDEDTGEEGSADGDDSEHDSEDDLWGAEDDYF